LNPTTKVILSATVTKTSRKVADVQNLVAISPGFICLVGPSGAGKSTIARTFALLEKEAAGVITIGDEVLPLPTGARAVFSRFCSYVDQSSYIWPHLTIASSIDLICEEHGLSSAPIVQFADQLGIAHLLQRYPSSLSGGERQRAAVLIGLASRPSFLALDEVTSNLDGWNRLKMLNLIRDVTNSCGVVLATQDLGAAEYLMRNVRSEKFAFIEGGRVQLAGLLDSWMEPHNSRFRDFYSASILTGASTN
jgi:ABC-type multidrug transport system ATPase subunit